METESSSEILTSTASGVEGGSVIQEHVCTEVRTLFESGLSKFAIAERLGLNRKTVRKYLSRPWTPQRRRVPRRPLDAFEPFVRNRAPEVGFNAKVLWREIQAQGYAGSYAALARRVQPLRDAARTSSLPTARFETEPGKQAQVDWGSLRVWLDDQPVRVHLFVMVLGYSRRVFARAYANEQLDALLDGHARAFEHFGGRTRTILYDNPRTIVLRKDEETGNVTWNAAFKDRMDFYGVDIRLCRYYRAQTKGKVESGVKYVKRNALAGRRFRDLDELNEWLTEWAVTIADLRIHGTTFEVPAERFVRAEAAALVSVEARVPAPRERVESRVVPSDALVCVETNRYPVALEWVGRRVQVRLLADEIVISSGDEAPVRYQRIGGRRQTARWQGQVRHFGRPPTRSGAEPPRWDPAYAGLFGAVEARPLEEYAAVLEEVLR